MYIIYYYSIFSLLIMQKCIYQANIYTKDIELCSIKVFTINMTYYYMKTVCSRQAGTI